MLVVRVGVKIISELNSFVEKVEVPLKFLPVQVGGSWNEREPPLQELALGCGGCEQALRMLDVEFHPRSRVWCVGCVCVSGLGVGVIVNLVV